MFAQRYSVKNCFSFLSPDKECESWPEEQAVFVHVGGGTGQKCIALKEKFRTLPGKVILQDLPSIVLKVELPVDIQPMVYDFFTPQLVQDIQHPNFPFHPANKN
jgi:demethylsterigmatocystin 6-O-methyltransferase